VDSTRLGLAVALAALSGMIAPAGAAAASSWRLEPPPLPAGAPFAVPLGAPGDLRFLGPGRGLLAVEGNAAIARGLYFYDGVRWRALSTVCGGPADTARIAWAGPTEFWTVTEPSRPRAGSGTALCHVKDGVVVGSYSTADSAADPYRQMSSAACNGPSDCWFGGVGSQDPLGQRVGAFHLHWHGVDGEHSGSDHGGVRRSSPSAASTSSSCVLGEAFGMTWRTQPSASIRNVARCAPM